MYTHTHGLKCVHTHTGYEHTCTHTHASQVALVVKNPPANAGNVRDTG